MKGRANKVNKLETARKAQIIERLGEKHDGQTTCKIRKWSAKPKQGERHNKPVLTRQTTKRGKMLEAGQITYQTRKSSQSPQRGKTLPAEQTTYEIKMARKAHVKRGKR